MAEVSLIGNIVVIATNQVRIRASSKLHDVIIIAPQVNVEDGTAGSFQVFASNQINVGKRANLTYPSVLAVKAKPNNEEIQQSFEPNIHLAEGAELRGFIIHIGNDEVNPYKPNIKINDRASVYGEVYCTDNVELKGNVYGTLFTANFVSLENGNIYQNHIYNGRIRSELLPKEYAGLNFENSNTNTVAKWLY